MSARAVARMYAALMGPVDGVRLVSPERSRLMTAVAAEGTDWTFGDGDPMEELRAYLLDAV